MAAHDSAKPSFKERAKEEFIDYLQISAYLTFFFCVLVVYTRLILRQHNVADETLNFAFAVINALIIAKVILIGEIFHLGRSAETRPLYQTIVIQAVLNSLLLLAFHFLEEFIKRLIHHEPAGTVIHEIRIYELTARAILVFCVFLPLFAFRELKLILGAEKVHQLFFSSRPTTEQPAS
jgi:hypothetical protein